MELLLYQAQQKATIYATEKIYRRKDLDIFSPLTRCWEVEIHWFNFSVKKDQWIEESSNLMMLLALCMAFLRLLEEYPLVELAIIALVSLCIYHHFFAVRPVNLHGKSTSPFTKLLKNHMPILNGFYS